MVLPCGHFVGGFVGVTKCHKKYMGCMLTTIQSRLAYLIFDLFGLFFSARTVFFIHNNLARTVFFNQFQPRFRPANEAIIFSHF